MKNPKASESMRGRGRQVAFVVGEKAPNHTDWMKQRIDTDKGRRIYSHRMWVVEPVFGNITIHKRLHRFSLRGKTKVNAQWQWFCMIHNAVLPHNLTIEEMAKLLLVRVNNSRSGNNAVTVVECLDSFDYPICIRQPYSMSVA